MKKYLILLASIMVFQGGYAQNENESSSLDDIINQQSQVNQINYSDSHYRNLWGRTSYLNLSIDNAKMSMKGESGTDRKSKSSFGFNWGNSFNFNKNPMGNVFFIGIDYTWIDFHYAKFDESTEWAGHCTASDSYPWGNKMNMIDYGMAIGPQVTFFPFTSLRKKGLDPIRVQAFFHVGYDVKLVMPKDVTADKVWDKYAWGHGLYTEFGASLDWDFIGFGYSHRSDSGIKFKAIGGDFDHTIMKLNESENRIFLQFRF